MAALVHHGTAIRFLCDQLWTSVYDEIGDGQHERADRLKAAVVPVIPGASIILACAYAERVVFDLKKTIPHCGNSVSSVIPKVAHLQETQCHFDLDISWKGWIELGNFYRLRHCFAHEFGRLTDKQRTEVQTFLGMLQSGAIMDGTTVVSPYFRIDGDELVMLDGWNNRLRETLVSFLRLFEKHGLKLVK